ncbi:AimR family lysis-lysogeny pheromone receptor [Oceanobacillus limi]|nr:AimR family lysis-lysogeny pheromone receptor [Oceanobacillus limi]
MTELTLGQVILLLSHEHNDEVAIELTRKYCLQSTNNEIQKKGLEFLYINGFYDDLKELIKLNEGSEHYSNRLWAKVYQIVLARRTRSYPLEQMRRELQDIKTDDPELRCLIEFTIVDTYYSQLEFGQIGNLLSKQQALFDAIHDQFMLSAFNLRLYQKLFIYYWKKNELIMARKYAFRAINQTTNPITKLNMHVNLALTYTFDTYYQGMYHLKEALKIAKKHNYSKKVYGIENHNIPFLSANFNKVDGISSEDPTEQAHIEIAKGNYDKATEILQDVELNSPFKLYYMGLATQDRNMLTESYKLFIEKRNDYFFSRLPLNALKEMGEI